MMFKEKYYQELGKSFKSKEEIITELINLEAILNLPKGTEYFISDIHGEIDGFHHILKTGAGIIGDKINKLFKDLEHQEKLQLSLLVSYPKLVLKNLEKDGDISPIWYENRIKQLIHLTRYCANKYSRSKVRKKLPSQFQYVIEELLYVDPFNSDKDTYYHQIIDCLIQLEQADDFIIALARVIKYLVIDHIHIVGDIFDRGKASDKVMDKLMELPSLDIQWGNHDVLWIGAFCGSDACLMTLLRIATRYGYLYELEKAYQINLRPLVLFAKKYYQPQTAFYPKDNIDDLNDLELLSQVHQALLVLQLKLESQIIKRRPEFDMNERLLLDNIKHNHLISTKDYQLKNTCFQLVNWKDTDKLTEEEQDVVEALTKSFRSSHLLKKHMHFLMKYGSLYTVYNHNLLYHGCIPMNEDGTLRAVYFGKEAYKGKTLFDFFEDKIRTAYRLRNDKHDLTHDYLWYAWLGKNSPIYGRRQMTTFERYFIDDKETHKEINDPYFQLRELETTSKTILEEFGLSFDDSHIINGHTPIHAGSGESPIKANGKIIVIDGGISKAYQKTTCIGGYTLINDSYGLQIITLQPFISVEDSFNTEAKTQSIMIDKKNCARKYIKDTTSGETLIQQIADLKVLLSRF